MRNARTPAAIVAALLVAASPLAAADPVWHVLGKGETVYSLSRTYGVSAEAILKANAITDPRKLSVGARLLIPSVHVVDKGETLYGIARRYGIPLAELLSLNGLKADALIRPGERLLVPGPAAAAAGSPSAGVPAPAGSGASGTAGAGAAAKPVPGDAEAGKAASATKPAAAAGAWPVAGPQRYLEGKLFGIAIESSESARIVAVRAGTVVSAGPFRGFGRVAFVQASDGLIYVYGGADKLEVKVGDPVSPGTRIGSVGLDLAERRPVAYFMVFRNGEAIDPRSAPREAPF
ncbi:MAG TPA: LysM peptidoglycan-binding domain-containing M23 family metallopeptidase [Spirochaetales bacterium]|nr:LysM peptidoglycan-binding domain-containing M23 family metallopeptidase [Spirochaetales bacterium]